MGRTARPTSAAECVIGETAHRGISAAKTGKAKRIFALPVATVAHCTRGEALSGVGKMEARSKRRIVVATVSICLLAVASAAATGCDLSNAGGGSPGANRYLPAFGDPADASPQGPLLIYVAGDIGPPPPV